MLRLYDQTRRRICLGAFFALCVLPTLVVAAWCVAWQLPSHARAETERLALELGLDVSIASLHHSRPGVIVYEKLKLSDPETGQSILRCGRLEATWTQTPDAQEQRHPAILLAFSQLEVEAGAADRLGQVLQRVLQGQNGRPEMEIRVAADQLTLRSAEDSQTLTNIAGGLGAVPGGVQTQVTFRIAGSDSPSPARLCVFRNRQLTPPANSVELHTEGNELPCRLLSVGLAEFRMLGAASRFSGDLRIEPTSAGSVVKLSGQLFDVDLGGLVSSRFSHKLQGTADLTIQQARFCQGRLEEVSGILTSGPGMISRSLIDAAAAHLRLDRSSQVNVTANVLPYDQLAAAFLIDPRGVYLEGRCVQAERGTVLTVGRMRLLGDPLVQPQPITALIQTLTPGRQFEAPPTRQADWLLQHLPASDVPLAPESSTTPATATTGRAPL